MPEAPESAPTNGLSPNDEAASAEGETVISLRQRFFNVQTLVSFAAAFAILYFLAARVDIDLEATWSRLRGASLPQYLLAIAVYYLTFIVRAYRWRLLLNNVGYHAEKGIHLPSLAGLTEIILLSWFANCVVPAKLGDAYRAYLLKRNARVSFSTTAGTILAERVIDVAILFGLLALSAFSILGQRSGDEALGIVELGLGFLVVMVIGMLSIGLLGSHIQTWLPERLQAFWGRFQHGTLRSFQQLPVVSFLTVLVWLGEALRLLFVTYALGIHLDFPMVLFVALANSLLTAIPFTPGGLGLVEAGVVGLFLGLGLLTKPDAVSVTLLDRTISYWSLVVTGLVLYLVSRKK